MKKNPYNTERPDTGATDELIDYVFRAYLPKLNRNHDDEHKTYCQIYYYKKKYEMGTLTQKEKYVILEAAGFKATRWVDTKRSQQWNPKIGTL